MQIELARIHRKNYSDDCFATMQRRDPMPSRSPTIVWLLFAVTICASLVVFAWMRATTILSVSTIVYFALLAGQLSVVCVWCALRLTSNFRALLASVLAVLACSFAFGLIEEASTKPKDILPYFGLHAVLLLAALGALRRSTFWQRRSGIKTEWRFSIAQLLALTTVVAVLATAMRHSVLFHEERALEAFLLAGSIVTAVASVVIWSLDIHWLLRLAAALGVALGLGSLFYFSNEYMLWFATCDFLTQAIVLAAWLAWGGILPIEAASAAETH
jgi:hypothetical protein